MDRLKNGWVDVMTEREVMGRKIDCFHAMKARCVRAGVATYSSCLSI